MGVEKQHIRICPEYILRAITMVGIPVDDQDTLATQLCLCVCGSHSHIVEQAKAARSNRFGMVAWWAD